MSEDAGSLWYQPDLDVFLNRWFSTYEDARKSLESEGGISCHTDASTSCASPK